MTLSLHPQRIDDQSWYYEEPKGICIVREIRDRCGHWIQTDTMLIKWAKIRKSLARKDQKKKRPVKTR